MRLDDFIAYMAPDLPGCPEPSMAQALLLSANDFCQQTLAWSEFQDPITLVSGVKDYDLDRVADGKPFLIRDVVLVSRRLRPVTMLELSQLLPNWQSATSTDPAYYSAVTDRSQITVYPTPLDPVQTQLMVRVAYTPTMNAKSLPDFLGDRYLDSIVSGAKARLFALQRKDFSNPTAVEYHWGIYQQGVITAKAEAMHERAPGVVTVLPRSFI